MSGRRAEELERENVALREQVAALEAASRVAAGELASLREEAGRFRAFFDNAPIGKSMTAPDGRLLRVNAALADLLGYSPDELQAMTFAPLTHPEDIPESRECIRALLAGERDVWSMEKRYLAKDGRVIWAHVTTRLQRDRSGAPLHLLTHVLDLSARKQAEARAAHLHAVLQAVRRVNQLILAETDRARLLARVCEALVQTRGYHAAWIALAAVPPLTASAGLDALAPALAEHLAGGIPECGRRALASGALSVHLPGEACEACPLAPAGVDLAGVAVPLRSDGRLLGVLGVATRPDSAGDPEEHSLLDELAGDVAHALRGLELESSGARATAALLASEAKYRRLHETMRDAFVMVDMEGRIVETNRAYRELLGYSEAELARLSYVDLTPARWHAAEAAIVAGQILPRGYSDLYEKEYVRRDGSVLPVDLRTFLVRGDDGQPAAMWAIVRDISERKRAEQALEARRQELLRSNHDLEQFAYVASHDLQEPLRMVASFTQLLAERYADALDQDARDFIGFAVEGATRMQRLIEDLLAYSRVSTRGSVLGRVDPHEALAGAVANLQTAIAETGALVTCAELPPVTGDLTQLTQLLQNLVGNSLKFRRPGEPPRVHLSAARDPADPGSWVFRVADNGIGIDPRHLGRLFTIFQRLHTREEYPGTGIGLALCKRIILQHGGRIWLESEPGRGTSCLFTLPSADRGHGSTSGGRP